MQFLSPASLRQQSVMYGDSSIIQRTKEHCLVGVKVQPLQREDIVSILVWSMVDPSWEGHVRKDQIG